MSDHAVRAGTKGDVAHVEGLQNFAVRIGGDVTEIAHVPARSAHTAMLRRSRIEMPSGAAAISRRAISAIVDMQPVHGIRFEAGHVQIEYGYNGDFKAQAFNVNQADTVTLLYNATATLQLQIDHDTFTSQTDPMGNRATASGDTHFFAQLTALRDTPKHPALALSWFTKFPTASTAQGLGSGRYDHKLIAQVSKEFGEYDVDFSAAVVVNGRPGLPGYQTGGQFALGVTRNYKSGVGLQAEIFGESIDSDEPRGKFALGAVSYQVNPRFAIDFGLRFGLNPAAPRFGVFGGVTFGLTNISRRKRR